MTATVLQIPTPNLEEVQEKFNKIAKRGRKLGLELSLRKLYTLSVEKLVKRDGRSRWVFFPYTVIEVTAPDEVRFSGWTLLGTIQREHSEPVLYSAPGRGIPEAYRTSDGTCDHCKTRRYRKEIFVLEKDGVIQQVGRNCLAEFLDDRDVKQTLALYTVLREASNLSAGEDYDGHGSSFRDYHDLENYVSMAACCIRHRGYTSARHCEEDYSRVRTAAQVWTELSPLTDYDRRNGIVRLEREEQDWELAAAAIEWARTQDGTEEYFRTLRILAGDGWFKGREAGVAASMVLAYQKAMNLLAAKEARAAEPKCDCPVGRIEVSGTIVKVETRYSDWGARLVMVLKDERGFAVWGTAPDGTALGDKIRMVATVTRGDQDPSFGFFKRPTFK